MTSFLYTLRQYSWCCFLKNPSKSSTRAHVKRNVRRKILCRKIREQCCNFSSNPQQEYSRRSSRRGMQQSMAVTFPQRSSDRYLSLESSIHELRWLATSLTPRCFQILCFIPLFPRCLSSRPPLTGAVSRRVLFDSVPDSSSVFVIPYTTNVSDGQLATLVSLLLDKHLVVLLVSCVLIMFTPDVSNFDGLRSHSLTCRFVLSCWASA